MTGGEALFRPRMKSARRGEPTGSEQIEAVPVGAGALAAAAQNRPPEPQHPDPKGPQAVEVPRYRMVVEVALHDRPEPLARLRHRVMQASAKLLLDFPQLGSQALADRSAFDGEVPVPVFPADVRESQKVERLGLPFSSSSPVRLGVSPELDPARLVWMEFQSKLLHPLPKIFQEAIGLRLVLEP